eukprot:g39787.t1
METQTLQRQISIITSSTLLQHPTKRQLESLIRTGTVQCCVCLEHLSKITRGDVVLHNERHAFHTQCFHEWLITKFKTGSVPCPMCRQETLRFHVRLRRLLHARLYSPVERVRLVALMTGLIMGWLTVVLALRLLRRYGIKLQPQGELGRPVTLLGILLTYTFGVCFGRLGEVLERLVAGHSHQACPRLVSEVVMWTLLLTGLGPDYRRASSHSEPSYGRLGRQLGQAFALRGNAQVNASYTSVLSAILGGWFGALVMKNALQPLANLMAKQLLAVLYHCRTAGGLQRFSRRSNIAP